VRNRSYSSGFTLIELLVVVSVIGIIVSIALLSLSVLGDDRQLRVEARRVGTLLTAAQDEAVMQGREFGLEVMRNAYRFVEYDPYQARWIELQTDDIFRPRQLPDDVEFDLLLEDKLVLLSAEAATIDDPNAPNASPLSKKYAPHIMIFSSGESTPFELRIVKRSKQQVVILQGDMMGAVDVLTVDEQADALR
jgi:general secretion pathway protein H